jgi:hypothetical protein
MIRGEGTKVPLVLLDKVGQVHAERKDKEWGMKVLGGVLDLLGFDLFILIFFM